MSAPVEVVLSGPSKNALGTRLMLQLDEGLAAAGGAPVLLRGEGDAFSAGLDLRELVDLDRDGMQSFLMRLNGVVERLFRYPGPTVACVNGHAIAGGAILALACDHRVATADPRARIGLNEVALGLRFPPGILDIVRHRVARIETVILGAGLHAPADAAAMGLVDEVADDPLAVAQQRLAALAAHPPAAYAHAKAALRDGIGAWDAATEQQFLEQVLPTWTSGEIKAMIRGFLDRSKR
ncbi:MAG: enoyl-CoA hydratase/isomerase family protein [Myxococcota bacterium]